MIDDRILDEMDLWFSYSSLFPDKAKDLLKKLIPEKWIEEERIYHELLKR